MGGTASVELTAEAEEIVERLMASRQFSTQQQVVQFALEELQAKMAGHASLQDLLNEAGDDEADIDPNEVYLRLKAEFNGAAKL